MPELAKLSASWLGNRRAGEEHDRGHWNDDEADGAELPLQVRQSPFLDGFGDLLHFRCAGVGGHDLLGEIETHANGEEGGSSR
jgi:hypothetical protein